MSGDVDRASQDYESVLKLKPGEEFVTSRLQKLREKVRRPEAPPLLAPSPSRFGMRFSMLNFSSAAERKMPWANLP